MISSASGNESARFGVGFSLPGRAWDREGSDFPANGEILHAGQNDLFGVGQTLLPGRPGKSVWPTGHGLKPSCGQYRFDTPSSSYRSTDRYGSCKTKCCAIRIKSRPGRFRLSANCTKNCSRRRPRLRTAPTHDAICVPFHAARSPARAMGTWQPPDNGLKKKGYSKGMLYKRGEKRFNRCETSRRFFLFPEGMLS